MSYRFQIDPACAWVNYVRSHDDIGWTFDDGDAGRLGISGYDHRRFLNEFYTGRFPGSFARGLSFQENPRTGDARISGTLASLAGLERALQTGEAEAIEHAIRRILLVHAVILSIGGIPLIYLGDEIGQLNDYGYRADPAKVVDSRWVHRPPLDEVRLEQRRDPNTIPGQIYARLSRLIAVRKATPGFAGNGMDVINVGSDHVFGFVRTHEGQRVVVLANFSEQGQTLDANELRLYGLSYAFRELISGRTVRLDGDQFFLEPYEVVWLAAAQS
jgi:amylosucrase